MTNAESTVRGLMVYALVLPLALILGVFLASPNDQTTQSILVLILLLLSSPLLLKWHHPMLVLCWNMTAVVFFIPGSPQLWLVVAFLSLILSFLQRALIMQRRWVHAGTVLLPLVFLLAVVLMTGQLTGGFGMRVLGSGLGGGKRYLLIFAGFVSFFALIARPVPPRHAPLYVGLFFLGSLMNIMGTIIPYTYDYWPNGLYFLSLIFPVTRNDVAGLATDVGEETVTRFYGLTLACTSVYCYLMARYGLREMMAGRKFWRFLVFLLVIFVGALGGFRSYLILAGMTFTLLLYFEGLVRSRYTIVLLALGLIAAAIVVPFANKLPLSFQRTLSFLPLNVEPVARYNAEASSEWRVRIWKTVWPEVPSYLWLGKGLSVGIQQLELQDELEKHGRGQQGDASLLAGDYHNGPLTILVPFGVWGAFGWLWFLAASLRALYLNHRFGPVHLQKFNTFLLAFFLAKTINYFFIFGNFYTDFADFTGLIAFSLALNGGIRRVYRAPRVVRPLTLAVARPQMSAAPAFSQSAHGV